MRAVRLSTAVGPHLGRFKGVWRASKLGESGRNPLKTPEKRLRNQSRMQLMARQTTIFGFAAPKQGRIGPPWKQKIGIWWGTS